MKYLLFALMTVLLTQSTVWAAPPRLLPPLEMTYTPPPLSAVPPGDDRIIPLRLKEPAPFAGQLMDPETAIRWVHYLQQARVRIKEDVLLERKNCNSMLDYYESRLRLERKAKETIEADLRKRLSEADQRNVDLQKSLLSPSIFKSSIFWFVAGVIMTGAIFGIGVAATM